MNGSENSFSELHKFDFKIFRDKQINLAQYNFYLRFKFQLEKTFVHAMKVCPSKWVENYDILNIQKGLNTQQMTVLLKMKVYILLKIVRFSVLWT